MVIANTTEGSEIECLDLEVVAYEDFQRDDPIAIQKLERALHDKGIVGIKGIPGYREKLEKFVESARVFTALPEHVKNQYAPDRDSGDVLGYERGKEKFQRPDGSWVIDDLKVSYYAWAPNVPENKWPNEVDLQTPYQSLGLLMAEMGNAVIEKVRLCEIARIDCEVMPTLGRMLYYSKSFDSAKDNPYWCGAHFDHGIFTTILPAFYFLDGQQAPEPDEAGLFVRVDKNGKFKKVSAQDYDVMMFQVGEFGQLASNDAIRATEHRVKKADGCIERYTMALFFNAQEDVIIHSTSELTQDARYGGKAGDPCSYKRWSEETYKRFRVIEEPSEKSS